MELAMQIISNDQAVRNNTVKDMKDFEVSIFSNTSQQRRAIIFYDACY